MFVFIKSWIFLTFDDAEAGLAYDENPCFKTGKNLYSALQAHTDAKDELETFLKKIAGTEPWAPQVNF